MKRPYGQDIWAKLFPKLGSARSFDSDANKSAAEQNLLWALVIRGLKVVTSTIYFYDMLLFCYPAFASLSPFHFAVVAQITSQSWLAHVTACLYITRVLRGCCAPAQLTLLSVQMSRGMRTSTNFTFPVRSFGSWRAHISLWKLQIQVHVQVFYLHHKDVGWLERKVKGVSLE